MLLAGSCVADERRATQPIGWVEPLAMPAGLELVSAHRIHGQDVGGLSAATGGLDHLILFSDRGDAWRATIARDPDHRITALQDWHELTLPDLPLQGSDIESAAIFNDGITLALERDHGVVAIGTPSSFAVQSPPVRPTSLQGSSANGGIEALATIDEHLLLITEKSIRADGHARAIWLKDGQEVEAGYAVDDGFNATGADATGDFLFVLERSLSIFGGWQARISAIPKDHLAPGTDAVIRPEKRLNIPRTAPVDNMEAIVVQARPDGRTEILLISDDNFNPLQQSILLQLMFDPRLS